MVAAQIIQRGKHWLLTAGAPPGTLRHRLLHRARYFAHVYLFRSEWARPASSPLDVYAPQALDEFCHPRGATPLEWCPGQAVVDEWGAARRILGILQRRPDLRQTIPQPLRQGADGAFGRWLQSEEASEYGLGLRASAHVRAAFARRLGERVRHLYDHHGDLRRTQPLALTPAGQRQLLHWLLKGGKEAYRLRDEEIWWFLFECAEDPSRGIAATYLLHADWQQRFPCGLTVFGRDALLQWIRRRYGISDEWLNQADLSAIYHPVDELRLWHATQPDVHAVAPRAFVESADTARLVDWLRRHEQRWPLTPAWWERLEAGLAEGLAERPGVNVVGYFCYPSGQAEAARFTVQSLQQVGIRTSCRDHPNGIDRSLPGRAAYLGQELFPYTILHLAPDAPVRRAYPLSNLAPRPGVYRIAVWYWELETAPAHWRRQARWVHEVWAPTRFIAEALRRIMPVPVVDMLPAVELSSHVPRPRRYFNLPDDCFLFLFLFDMCSVMERKNPLGLIRAFQQAFAPTDHAHLAIKVTRGDADPASLARLHEAAERAGVTVLDRLLTREDSYALLDCADCYVSLHRSEGFGLTMAESMLLGKPVIATGYSGNLDFMTRENSLLVDYRRVPITTKLPIYPRGAFWAEPSVEEAARLMRWVFEHPAAARNLGARAKAEVSRLLSPQSAGERMARRLRELH